MPRTTFEIRLSRVRLLWLEQGAHAAGRTLEQHINAILHNASLDTQMALAPESDPGESPGEVAAARAGRAG